jgi:hypothetical protein
MMVAAGAVAIDELSATTHRGREISVAQRSGPATNTVAPSHATLHQSFGRWFDGLTSGTIDRYTSAALSRMRPTSS